MPDIVQDYIEAERRLTESKRRTKMYYILIGAMIWWSYKRGWKGLL